MIQTTGGLSITFTTKGGQTKKNRFAFAQCERALPLKVSLRVGSTLQIHAESPYLPKITPHILILIYLSLKGFKPVIPVPVRRRR